MFWVCVLLVPCFFFFFCCLPCFQFPLLYYSLFIDYMLIPLWPAFGSFLFLFVCLKDFSLYTQIEIQRTLKTFFCQFMIFGNFWGHISIKFPFFNSFNWSNVKKMSDFVNFSFRSSFWKVS